MRAFFLLALLLATSAAAQTTPTSPARQRAAARQALRDARRTEAPYKDSHLAVTRQQLRRGSTEGPPRLAEAPRLRRDGRPRTGLPLLHRRADNVKTEPTP